MPAEDSLRAARLQDTLTDLQGQVRKDPSNPRHRVFLFQLLCVLGDWDRARDQLKVLAELDPGSLALVHVYGAAIGCELFRREVFAGTRTPLVLGEPLPWVALLVQALAAGASGGADVGALRADALEQAPAVTGTIDGHAFEWLADADSRTAPVFEAMIDGKITAARGIRSVVIEPPADLRDVAWPPAHLVPANGGEAAARCPRAIRGRSPTPPAHPLGRKTEGDEVAPQTFHGRAHARHRRRRVRAARRPPHRFPPPAA
jgi:type VI secretion system protein ImpE